MYKRVSSNPSPLPPPIVSMRGGTSTSNVTGTNYTDIRSSNDISVNTATARIETQQSQYPEILSQQQQQPPPIRSATVSTGTNPLSPTPPVSTQKYTVVTSDPSSFGTISSSSILKTTTTTTRGVGSVITSSTTRILPPSPSSANTIIRRKPNPARSLLSGSTGSLPERSDINSTTKLPTITSRSVSNSGVRRTVSTSGAEIVKSASSWDNTDNAGNYTTTNQNDYYQKSNQMMTTPRTEIAAATTTQFDNNDNRYSTDTIFTTIDLDQQQQTLQHSTTLHRQPDRYPSSIAGSQYNVQTQHQPMMSHSTEPIRQRTATYPSSQSYNSTNLTISTTNVNTPTTGSNTIWTPRQNNHQQSEQLPQNYQQQYWQTTNNNNHPRMYTLPQPQQQQSQNPRQEYYQQPQVPYNNSAAWTTTGYGESGSGFCDYDTSENTNDTGMFYDDYTTDYENDDYSELMSLEGGTGTGTGTYTTARRKSYTAPRLRKVSPRNATTRTRGSPINNVQRISISDQQQLLKHSSPFSKTLYDDDDDYNKDDSNMDISHRYYQDDTLPDDAITLKEYHKTFRIPLHVPDREYRRFLERTNTDDDEYYRERLILQLRRRPSSYHKYRTASTSTPSGSSKSILPSACAGFSIVGFVFLLMIGILLDTQPLYIQGVLQKQLHAATTSAASVSHTSTSGGKQTRRAERVKYILPRRNRNQSSSSSSNNFDAPYRLPTASNAYKASLLYLLSFLVSMHYVNPVYLNTMFSSLWSYMQLVIERSSIGQKLRVSAMCYYTKRRIRKSLRRCYSSLPSWMRLFKKKHHTRRRNRYYDDIPDSSRNIDTDSTVLPSTYRSDHVQKSYSNQYASSHSSVPAYTAPIQNNNTYSGPVHNYQLPQYTHDSLTSLSNRTNNRNNSSLNNGMYGLASAAMNSISDLWASSTSGRDPYSNRRRSQRQQQQRSSSLKRRQHQHIVRHGVATSPGGVDDDSVMVGIEAGGIGVGVGVGNSTRSLRVDSVDSQMIHSAPTSGTTLIGSGTDDFNLSLSNLSNIPSTNLSGQGNGSRSQLLNTSSGGVLVTSSTGRMSSSSTFNNTNRFNKSSVNHSTSNIINDSTTTTKTATVGTTVTNEYSSLRNRTKGSSAVSFQQQVSNTVQGWLLSPSSERASISSSESLLPTRHNRNQYAQTKREV